MRPVNIPTPRDPAPSRLAYRFQRIWLTPLFRALLRTGIPAFSVALMVGWWVTREETVERLSLWVMDVRSSIQERPEFQVRLMELKGATDEVAEDIREILPVDFPISSFDLNLAQMRETVSGLDAVAEVSLRLKAGGILEMTIRERLPVVVWQGLDGLELLDGNGKRVSSLGSRMDRPDLPLIGGEAAHEAVPEALRLLGLSRPIGNLVIGLNRIGARRWDVVLASGQVIMLPELQPELALERVIAMDEAEDVFNRDVIAVDMRNPTRPTLRMSPPALEELRRVRALKTKGLSE